MSKPRRIRIDKVLTEWRVWVPVRGPQDYDESYRHPAAPYGESFWPSWPEALHFAELVIDLEAPG